MDGSQFDALTRILAAAPSRRGLSRFVGALVLGGPLALTRAPADAKGGIIMATAGPCEALLPAVLDCSCLE